MKEKYLRTESFMAPNGVMMERDIYGCYPDYHVKEDGQTVEPEISLCEVSTEPRPQGKMFKGKNRKERRRLKAGNKRIERKI